MIVVLVLCLQVSSAWAGASRSPEDLYYLAQKSYYQLKGSPEKQKLRHHWEYVINKFSTVLERHPKSPQAYKAVFTIASLYEGLNEISKNSKDLDQALHYYKKVSQDYSGGSLTDDALFEAGQIYKDTNNLLSAKEIFKTIFEKYPTGDQAKKARSEYQKLATVSSVPTVAQQVVVRANSKANVLKNKTKPIALKQVDLPTRDNKNTNRLKKLEKSEIVARLEELQRPVDINSVSLSTAPAQQKTELKHQVVTKRVVASKAEPILEAPVKKALFNKAPGGHLYAPSTGNVQSSAPLIVVDAGHGGKDQGAKSAKGLHEKDVNLTIARHVKTILVNRFKYQVVMTRKDDTFIPLKERSAIANNRNAELFVSIHANAAERKSAHGIETYFLGTTHSDDALATAARENGELVYSVKDDQVQQILASLITTTKINDSSRLAGTVQENIYQSSRKKFRELKNLGVKEGPFYVLHGADMPSILVEVGFLTNRKEAKMLSNPAYLYRLASSIAEGIHQFMQDKGPSI